MIKKIFLKHGLGKVKSIKKIEIGFTNKVYLINDKFILKVCEDVSNEENFRKEVFFYNLFKNKIPVPKIKVFDDSKKIYRKIFTIYPKIKGENLYSKWHLLSDKDRRTIIKQLCKILKIINKAPHEKSVNWHDKVLGEIKNSLEKIGKKKLLSRQPIKTIEAFINKNHHVLNEQKIALVYWDAHFDNILVQGNKIVGILDFERTELASIDFGLDIIKRMIEYPKKYMSKESEKFAKKEDYAKLLDWFAEFYPELFNFKNLNKRLDLYALNHDLDTLLWYPRSKEVKEMIAKTVTLASYYIIIRGPLGSGKSTISEELAKILNAKHVHMDKVLEQNGLDKMPPSAPCISAENFIKASEIVLPEVKTLLKNGKIVIFDACFYHKKVIDHLIGNLAFPHYIFTLKAPLALCIKRDHERTKTHGKDAAGAVHSLVSKFDYGINIDVSGNLRNTLKDILSYLPTKVLG